MSNQLGPVDFEFAPQGVPVVLPQSGRHAGDFPVERADGPATTAIDDAVCKPQDTHDPKLAPRQWEYPPKPSGTRFQSLDAVRGMACIMLLAYHATFYADHSWSSTNPSSWTWGGLAINLVGRLWIGVPMFFVVSGYCIAASIDSLRRKPHSLSQYFWRRLRRIYPPLWVAFGFVIGFTFAVRQFPRFFDNCRQLPRMEAFSAMDWLGNLSATTSWLPGLFGDKGKYLLTNTWTLCYEEQFYAVTGVLLVFTARRFFAAAYGVVLATLVVRHLNRIYCWPINGIFLDGHWILFSAGILLYHQVHYLRGTASRLASTAMWGFACYGLIERLTAEHQHDRHVGEYILVASLFAFALSKAKPFDRSIAEHWFAKPFLCCGKFSYSIYLTHFPITVAVACCLARSGIHADHLVFLVTLPICLAISLPIAYLFYLSVERRFSTTS